MPDPIRRNRLAEHPSEGLDVAAAHGARRAVAHMERNLGGVDLWNKWGLGQVVEAAIDDYLPRVSPIDVLRNIGLLKPEDPK